MLWSCAARDDDDGVCSLSAAVGTVGNPPVLVEGTGGGIAVCVAVVERWFLMAGGASDSVCSLRN